MIEKTQIEKTQIEKIIDAIELKNKLKDDSLDIVKKNKQEDWNKEIEESPFNEYYGVDIKCAVILTNAINRGMGIKEAAQISENFYGIPIARTRNLLHKYVIDSKEVCDGFDKIIESQRKGFNKKLVNIKRQSYNKK